MNPRQAFDYRFYLQIIIRRKWLVILPVVTGIGAGFIRTLFLTPYYESWTILEIQSPRTISRSVGRPPSGVSLSGGADAVRRRILSRENLRQLIAILGLKDNQRLGVEAQELAQKFPDLSMDEVKEMILLNRLRRRLRISVLRGGALQISATSPTAQQAFALAKTMTQVFIDQSLKNEISGIRSALVFGEEQMAIYKQRLEESEDRLRKLERGQLRFESPNLRGKALVVQDISSAISQLDLELWEKKDQLKFLENELRGMESDGQIFDSPGLSTLKAELLERTVRLPEIMLKYSWKDAAFIRYNNEIIQLKKRFREELADLARRSLGLPIGEELQLVVDKEMTTLEVELLNRKKAAYKSLLDAYGRTGNGNIKGVALSLLRQEVDANREIYEMFLGQTKRYQIQEALERKQAESRFRILEPAQKPLKPKVPSKAKVILLAAMVGLTVGAGLVYGLEYVDSTFKNVEDVAEFLSLPVLGTLPSMPVLRPRRSRKPIVWSILAMIVVLGVVYMWYYLGLQLF